MGLCVGMKEKKKRLQTNEIAGFGGLDLFLVILSELKIKPVIGFGRFINV
jgi:hypothetical protein